MASGPFASPFANSAIQRAAVLSYAVVEEVHGLLDQPFIPRRVNPRVRRLGVAGLIFFGTLISTLGKLGRYIVQPWHKVSVWSHHVVGHCIASTGLTG